MSSIDIVRFFAGRPGSRLGAEAVSIFDPFKSKK